MFVAMVESFRVALAFGHLVLCASCCGAVIRVADIPQSLFLTDNGFVHVSGSNETFLIEDDSLESAASLDEARPALLDKEGNWGFPVEGFQLSLRFTKWIYTNGEPIEAVILLRNVTENILDSVTASRGAGEYEFSVTGAANQRVPLLYNEPQDRISKFGGSPKAFRILPRTQRKFVVELGRRWQPRQSGTYIVSVWRNVMSAQRGAMAELRSGNALLRIVGTTAESDGKARAPQASKLFSASASPSNAVRNTTTSAPLSKPADEGPSVPVSGLPAASSGDVPSGMESETVATPASKAASGTLAVTSQPGLRWLAVTSLALLAAVGGILLLVRRRKPVPAVASPPVPPAGPPASWR